MKDLKIHNSRFITYSDAVLTADVLGGVDTQQIERMICTLRISFENYPPLRSTLDLYNDNQTDKLIRTLCDKWNLQLTDCSTSVHSMIAQLESYKLQKLKYPQQKGKAHFEQSEEEAKQAKKYLADKKLTQRLQSDLQKIGILGEAENALILFLSMASHKFSNPFSVLCLAKSGIGKSYLLQKLSELMPRSSYSLHTQISENALYYFDSHQIDGKVLFIEDLEWTQKMLMPLATLQTQGKLIKTRATKDKDGMLHSTTFEVVGKLCLIACAYAEKSYDQISLPFLCLHLNHSPEQDFTVMEYQKRFRAGLINQIEIAETQRRLKCALASLQNISVINPYAPFIHLPDDLPQPRKTLLLLLNFIDVITYFHQYQRETVTDESTGEIFIKTHPDDIKLAFKLLKSCLFRRVDELSTTARGFYNWLQKFLAEAKTDQFTALDIRKAKRIHPRTLNNYLNELKLYNYVQIVGGNKHREGYRYKLTNINELNQLQNGIETDLKKTMDKVNAEHQKQSEKGKKEETEPTEPQAEPTEPKEEPTKKTTPKPTEKTEAEPTKKAEPIEEPKPIQIEEKEKQTLKILLQLETEKPKRTYQAADFTDLTGKSHSTESRHLKSLLEKQILNREAIENNQYAYRLTETYEIEELKQATNNAEIKRKRIKEKEKHTLKIMQQIENQEAGREYLPEDIAAITGRNPITEARHLKTLYEQGTLSRAYKNRQYHYQLKTATTSRQQVSKTPPSDLESLNA
jgi:DNA-binding transcriptional ArsR family regulator